MSETGPDDGARPNSELGGQVLALPKAPGRWSDPLELEPELEEDSAFPSIESSPLLYARLLGYLYLVIITFGIFSEVVVRGTLVEAGDPSATAANLRSSEWLFRLGFAADLVVFLSAVAVALILYLLLRPVNRALSMVAAGFRLTQTAILGLNLLNMSAVLLILGEAEYLGDHFEAEQLDALGLLFLDLHKYGYVLGLTFFALHALVVGYLVFVSGFLPKVLGVLLALAGMGSLIDNITFFLVPGYDGGISPVVLAPAFIAEISFCFWLVFRGIDTEEWHTRATRPPPQFTPETAHLGAPA